MLQKFILFICYSLFFTCLPLHAQQEVNLNLKNVTIEQAIKAIEKQTEYTFMFDNTLDLSQKLPSSLKMLRLKRSFRKCLPANPFRTNWQATR
ncbi:MAG: STN domain-containing protein [Tannerellaceae bacterium]|nr:STN domain-containing protein [Tannerellaceae bacterium]